MIKYEKYMEEVNKILEEQYGIGAGTISYKNANKEAIALSLVMIDLINKLDTLNEKDEIVEKKRTTRKSATEKPVEQK